MQGAPVTATREPPGPTPASRPESTSSRGELGDTGKKTIHLILERFDRKRQGIEVLHKDLFDSSAEVVLSALETLGRLKDPRSLKHIARLLTHAEEGLRCAAARAAGAIGHPLAAKLLFDLFKTARSETLRSVVLEALARLVPGNAQVVARLKEYSASQLVKPETRVAATYQLLRIKSDVDLSALLSGAREETLQAVYDVADEDRNAAAAVVQHGLSNFHRLSAENRRRLLRLASPFSKTEAARILLEALEDVDADVRFEAYRSVGRSPAEADALPAVILHLSERVDPLYSLEEEAIAAIQRLEELLAGSTGLDGQPKRKVLSSIEDLFALLGTSERQVGSDHHELGWLISRSKEYLEYYADEDLRQGLLHYLKGSPYYTRERILGELKASAVKIEVRHFDGYRALTDIINTPKRAGIGLISREWAIAKLGRRKILSQLIRNLRLVRLFDTAALGPEAAKLYQRIFSWAKQAKLYRLADGALHALAKADVRKATAACQECLAPPVFSKICAIAAIHLLKTLDWTVMEPAVARLLAAAEDPHVLLNLVEALAGSGFPLRGEMVETLVRILRSGEDQELVQRVAEYLGSQSASSVAETVIEGFDRAESWRQRLMLSILERQIREGTLSNREGLVEFLYRILRGEEDPHRAQAAVLLWRLGDDYAEKVLKEFLLKPETDEKIEILRGLKGSLAPEIVPGLLPLLGCEHAALHEALRETLLSAEGEAVQERICRLALAARGEGSMQASVHEELAGEDIQVDFLKEKTAYRFEREYVQELAVLFTDIQGYSKKAQMLSTLQLTTLIHEYEGILLPTVLNHRGELIKKMGDGHLFVFETPLDAVVAAIRVQKALKRFNSYREEAQRVVARIGIHWGKVVRKEGDVLGNHVNIASRLESSAKGGSILISDALSQRLQGYIHSREIGLINIKGIAEPIKVHEPYEIVVDFPAELDPLKSKRETAPLSGSGSTSPGQRPRPAATAPASGNGDGQGKALIVDQKTLSYVAETFSFLDGLCRQAEARQIEVCQIRRELRRRWQEIGKALNRRTP